MTATNPAPEKRGERGKWLPVPETKEKALVMLARYDSGEMIKDIAQDHGITHQAAYKALLKYCQDDWRDSQAARALAEYEAAKGKLQKIWKMKKADRDAVALACAREEVRAAQWELERLLARLYAQKQEVKIDVNVNLAERLIRARERVSVVAPTPNIIDVAPLPSTEGVTTPEGAHPERT